MSTDASNCYRLLTCLRAGTLDDDLQNILCGRLCHSRWLTLGEALMMIYMSEHSLEGETYKKFILLVKYVSQVYFQLLFDIKVKHSILEGPYHILTHLRLIRKQSRDIQDIVNPFI